MKSGFKCLSFCYEEYLEQGYTIFVDNFYSSSFFSVPTGAQNFYVQNDVQGQARFPMGAEGHAMGEASEERRRVVAVRGWNTLPSVERQANHASGEHHAHGESKGEAKQCVERNSYREAKTCRRLNYGMLGVEKSSQLIVSYSVLMKRVRWRKTPFFPLHRHHIFQHLDSFAS